MSAFVLSFFVIFVAELGDKSQLVALWFATRYRWWLVIAGVTAATLVVHLGSVAIGRAFGELLPEDVVLTVVALSFFFFAWWSLRGDTISDEDTARQRMRVLGAFGIVASSFFFSELGDKTQLATVTLAGDRPEIWMVWLGSTAGMVVADGMAIGVGRIAGTRLPQRSIAVGAALLFVVFGVLALVRAWA